MSRSKTPTSVAVIDENISPKPFADALSERYLAYALSTIMARSLPDVRDGLKPVHRRLLYAMRELRLAANHPPKKSARVVGDVIGKFHPHGDTAVYDALVRLAQDFNVRYPMVDGQGNFGNIDGDNAAAMRYTEARLTAVAEALMLGLDEDAVDFRATYDNGGIEPVVMPAAFPNLLANGSTGIAVGMATSIPPHNVDEICSALRHLIKYPNAGFDKLLDLMPGPDFPTGGVLVENRDTLLEAYKTGRGSFRLRAKWTVEKLGLRGESGNWQIVVTEMPWQVAKSRLIEKVAELLQAKKLPLLDDIRDESADDVRLVLVPKSKSVDPAVLMEQMFRLTDFETRISLNMNVLDASGTPRVMNIREVLQAFLDHRYVVLERRTNNRLAQIADRLETLEGLLICYLNIDAVIKIIRNEDEPKAVLMKKFKLTERQADAILNMRLRALRKLEEIEIKKEHDELSKEQKELKGLLKSTEKRWATIDGEIAEIKTKFGKTTALGKRRCELGDAPLALAVPIESIIEREPVTVFVSEKGWARTMKGHVEDSGSGYKEGDGPRFAIQCETTDKLALFASNGRFYTIGVDKLPRGRGYGEPLSLTVDMGPSGTIVALRPYREDERYLVASGSGYGFVVAASEILAQTKNGKQILNVPEGDAAVVCVPVPPNADHVAVIGTNRKMLIFPLSDVPEMAKGKGVMLQKYHGGKLSDAQAFKKKEGFVWSKGGKERTETEIKMWVMARGNQGYQPPHGFPASNKFND